MVQTNNTPQSPTDYRITLDETWVIKAIAIIAMLFHHLFYRHPEFGNTIVNVSVAGKVCVAIFVFLSGYGMAISFPWASQNNAKTFFFVLCKRFAKFFLNYWFIFFIAVPIGIFFFGRSLETAYENHDIIKSFFKDIIGQQGYFSYNVTWWFNAIILALWAFFPFLYLILKNKFISIVFLIFLCINPNDILYSLHFIATDLPSYILPFSLGIFIALHINTINRVLNFVHPYIVLGLSLIVGIILLYLRAIPVFTDFTKFKVDPFATVFVVLAVVSLCRVTSWRFAFMQYVGKHSMNMYLTHTFIFGYFFADFIYGFKYPVLIFLALFTTSLLLSICIEFVKRRIGFYRLQGKVVGIINRVGGLVPKEHDNAH